MPRLMLGSVVSRAWMSVDYLRERWCNGAPRLIGDPRNGTIFLLDGVGGVGLAPTLARVAFRRAGVPLATYFFDWHRGLPGEMLCDLMCLRANRRAGLRLARIIRQFRRDHPSAPLHVLSHSGGTGVAVFAAEKLGKRTQLDTLILAASALSPDYPLEGALRNVRRCVAFTSRRDRFILGLGTSLFGTVDRRFGRSAGLMGFRQRRDGGGESELWSRYQPIEWQEEMADDGHCGHHTGCVSVAFIQKRIVPLLQLPPPS